MAHQIPQYISFVVPIKWENNFTFGARHNNMSMMLRSGGRGIVTNQRSTRTTTTADQQRRASGMTISVRTAPTIVHTRVAARAHQYKETVRHQQPVIARRGYGGNKNLKMNSSESMSPTGEAQRLLQQQGDSNRRESGSHTSSNRSRHSSESQEGEDQGEYGEQDGQEIGSSNHDEYDDDDDSDIHEPAVCRTYDRTSASVRTNQTSVPSRAATSATSDITESHRNVMSNEMLIETCEVMAVSRGRGKVIEQRRDTSVKSRVEKYTKTVVFKRIKFIADQEELGSLRENGSIGNIIMDYMMIEDKSKRYSWWVLYQDVVKKAMDQQRSNCNIAMKEVVVGKSFV